MSKQNVIVEEFPTCGPLSILICCNFLLPLVIGGQAPAGEHWKWCRRLLQVK